MTSVRCPICDRNMASSDREGLSAVLRDHLSDEHDVEVLKESDRSAGTATPTGQMGSEKGNAPDVAAMKEGSRLHRAELRREEQFYAPEKGTEVPPRPKGIGDWVKKSLGTNAEDGGKDEWAQGEGYPTMMDRKGTAARERSPEPSDVPPLAAKGEPLEERGSEGVDCPICGEPIVALDEDTLTVKLREHVAGTHQLVRQETSLRP